MTRIPISPSRFARLPYALILLFLIACAPQVSIQSSGAFPRIDPDNVTIVRDVWGVPHIFGKTDADVAYGLAWANAEDAFDVMQETLLTGKGMLGRVTGRDGAIRDYILRAFDIPSIVDRLYAETFSEEFKRYLDGYVQGLSLIHI